MDKEVIAAFNAELASLIESRPPIGKTKIVDITKAALRAIRMYKHVVFSVEKFLGKCKAEYKIPCLYVIDSILRQSKRQFKDKDVFAARFAKNFENTLVALLQCSPADRLKIVRTLNLWEANGVYTASKIAEFRKICETNGVETDQEAVEKAVKGEKANLEIYKTGEKDKKHPQAKAASPVKKGKSHSHRPLPPPQHDVEDNFTNDFFPVHTIEPVKKEVSDGPSEEVPPNGVSESVLLTIIQMQMLDVSSTASKDRVLLKQIHAEVCKLMKDKLDQEAASKKKVSVKSLLASNFEYSDEEDNEEESEEPNVPPAPLTNEQLFRLAENVVIDNAMNLRKMHGERITSLTQAALEAKQVETMRVADEMKKRQREREEREKAALTALMSAPPPNFPPPLHQHIPNNVGGVNKVSGMGGNPLLPSSVGLSLPNLPNVNLAATGMGLLPSAPLDQMKVLNTLLGVNPMLLGGMNAQNAALLAGMRMNQQLIHPPVTSAGGNLLGSAGLGVVGGQLNVPTSLAPPPGGVGGGGGLGADFAALLSHPPPSLPHSMKPPHLPPANTLQGQQPQQMNMNGSVLGVPPALSVPLPGGGSGGGVVNTSLPPPSFTPHTPLSHPPPSLLTMDTTQGMHSILQQQQQQHHSTTTDRERRDSQREHRDKEDKERRRERDDDRGKRKRSRDRDRDRDRSDRDRDDDRRGEKKRKRSRSRERRRSRDREEKEDRERRKLALPSHTMQDAYIIASCTLWFGRLPTNITEEELRMDIAELHEATRIQIIGFRGCAYVQMKDRRSAVKMLDRLKGVRVKGREVKLSWACGEGVKSDQWKEFFDEERGISTIPHHLLPSQQLLKAACEGGWLDMHTVPPHMAGVVDEHGSVNDNAATESTSDGAGQPSFELSQVDLPPPAFSIPPPQAMPPNNGFPFGIPGAPPFMMPPIMNAPNFNAPPPFVAPPFRGGMRPPGGNEGFPSFPSIGGRGDWRGRGGMWRGGMGRGANNMHIPAINKHGEAALTGFENNADSTSVDMEME